MLKSNILFPNSSLNKVFINDFIDLSLQISNLESTFSIDLSSFSFSPGFSHCISLMLNSIALSLQL